MAAERPGICTLVLLILVAIPAYSFSTSAGSGGNVHDEITRQALSEMVSDANLNFLIKVVDSQNAPGSEAESEVRRHFSDSNFGAAMSYMDREKKQALNFAGSADSDAADRAQALRHFGLMLHTAQDFYSHTNYIELLLEDTRKAGDPLGLELVDWTRVPDGYAGKVSGSSLAAGAGAAAKSGPGAAEALGATDFSKDNANTPQSKKKAGGVTYFDISKELAVRETQRQWNLFEALVRGRFHERAPAIVEALKKAAPAAEASPDSLPEVD